MADRMARKEAYAARLIELLTTYKNIILVGVDNVGSNQMQKTRVALRGKAIILMGKNTIIRKVVREQIPNNPKLEALLPYIFGNIGMVFTNTRMPDVRTIILNNKRPAAAKTGQSANNDVFVPPGPTGLDPGQTSFFQALNIATKIVKGAIEIINQVHLLKRGDKVTTSHVALLQKLNIMPFFHGFTVNDVFEDGTVYSASILDITQESLMAKFMGGVSKVASISLAIGFPTAASLPHSVASAFKKLLAISLVTDIEFEQSKKIKALLSDPAALAAAQAAAAGASSSSSSGAAPKDEKPKVEEKPKKKEESEQDLGFSLFD